ncbi:MAG: hypothetical protein K1000chlam2_01111 [Chlamydiae bacterium]|nr:hypothetical protein [Chlamydiota bacterium]
MKIVCVLAILFVTPLMTAPIPHFNSAEMWWCKSCDLAYPASQKTCLNKNCPMFRKPR